MKIKKLIGLLVCVVAVVASAVVVSYKVNSSADEADKEADNKIGVTEKTDENVEGADNSAVGEDRAGEFKDIFAEELYYNTYNTTTLSHKIIKKPKESSEFYTKDDAYELALKVIEPKYDFVVVEQGDDGVMYKEFQNEYPTGAYANYWFDEDGTIREVYYRKGVVYDFDKSQMISYDEAYNIAVDAIHEKYGEDVMIKGIAEDYEYEIMYKPDKQELCYHIQEVIGHSGEIIPSDIGEVYFYIMVGIDGSYVEVASTLGY